MLGDVGTPDEPLLGIGARRRFVPLHGAVQHDRPARDLGAAVLEAPATCRSASSSWARTVAKTCCSGSRAQLETARPVGRPPAARARLTPVATSASRAGRVSTATRRPPVDALLAEGVDYLCLEALAELTLAILQKDRQRDEARGYTATSPRISPARCRSSPTAARR